MHSDSSDDENLELLKEAQDNDFLSDSLFKNPKGMFTKNLFMLYHNFFFTAHLELVEKTSEKQANASLRKCKDENEQFNTLGVTPEFQKYIGKQLSAILDEKLEKIIKSKVSNEKPVNGNNQTAGGIKLFSDSEYFLELNENQVDGNIKHVKNTRKLTKKLQINEEDLKSLAVSGEAILKKEDLKYWSNRTKGKVFSYKKVNNGQLMLIE